MKINHILTLREQTETPPLYQPIELNELGQRIDDFDDEMTEEQLDAWLANADEKIQFRDYVGFRFGDRIYSYMSIAQ